MGRMLVGIVPAPCIFLSEPRHEETGFLHMRNQKRRSAKLISAFVFATQIVQFFFFLNPKFQASNCIQWLHSPVCVGPGRKPRRPVFSQRGSSLTVSVRSQVSDELHVTLPAQANYHYKSRIGRK